MNWIQFGRLIHSIYSRNGKLPDIEWIHRQGLLAVKLGQVHALRIDLLDPKKCEHLTQLYRKVPPLPAEDFFTLLDKCALDYEQLLRLFRIHGLYMFVVGTFHGDLHPGNVLFGDGNFYFIDTGYIGTVSEQLRRGLFWFFEGLTRYDYSRCAEAMHSMSTMRLPEPEYAAFQIAFFELYDGFEGATVSEASLTTKMMQTIKLAVRSGMSFDNGMFSIIRSLMYLDGMVLRCNPQANLIRDMREPVEEMLERFPGLRGDSEQGEVIESLTPLAV
jgi:predicted unusual protein kinase regulating ubiquinone biosynthesis (AarF/ABC1/UbiB family)